MPDSSYNLQPSGTGQSVDIETVTTGAGAGLARQVVILGDDTTGAARVRILNGNPAGTEYAAVVRNIPSGTQTISGAVTVSSGSITASLASATTVTLQSSAAQTASGNSGAGLSVGAYRTLKCYINVTAASGTNPQLSVILQSSPDAGTTWFDDLTLMPLTNVTSVPVLVAQTMGAGTSGGDFGTLVRVRWIVSGTTPSVTFSVTAIGK